jgi:hypothetical protein
MKASLVLILVSLGAATGAFADLLTYRFAGVVRGESSQGRFVVGRPYTLTITIDTAAAGVATIPERKDYNAAIVASIFDYDSGAYIAAGTNAGKVSVTNDDRGLYDHFKLFALPGFPPVGGQNNTGSWLFLTDTAAVVFASTELPRALHVDSFPLRHFSINWRIDWNTRSVNLSIDSISLIQRRPEITAWNRTAIALVLSIEFPAKPNTNLLERSFELGATAPWEVAGSFVSSGGNTNWSVPLLPDQSAVFYRVRGN